MGINFIDTVVRKSLNKGTLTTDKPTNISEFMGNQNKQQAEDRLKLAGNLQGTTEKGMHNSILSTTDTFMSNSDYIVSFSGNTTSYCWGW